MGDYAKMHIHAWKVANSWMRDMKLTTWDFRLKCSSATRISVLVHPALMAWQNLKTPWIHNFLPPSGKSDESYQESVLDDTESEYFPSEHNVSTCHERHTLRVLLHSIPNMSIMILQKITTVNLIIEVILRNGFGKTSHKCLIMNRDYTWHGIRECIAERVSMEVRHGAQVSAPRFPGIFLHKTLYAS